jgi:hypothetical protein
LWRVEIFKRMGGRKAKAREEMEGGLAWRSASGNLLAGHGLQKLL